MGGRRQGGRQPLHHEPGAAPPRAHAQKKTLIARERDEAARAAWRAEAATLDPADLVFLDETAAPTNLTRLRARAPRAERAYGRVPRGRWRTATLLATLTPEGLGASVMVEGAADRDVFDAFVEQRLVPALRPGQTVVLDNLSVHKSARARRLVEDAGRELRFLPTYSPDLNPIEQAFAKVKAGLRRAEPRTYEAVLAAAGPAMDAVTPADARAFFADAGFPLRDQPQ